MKKESLSIMTVKILLAVIIFAGVGIIIVSGIYFYFNPQTSNQNEKYPYSEITYDSCLDKGNSREECRKYIFTRNAKMEQELASIMNEVIQEQSQKGVTISVKKIRIINLAGRLQGSIGLNCEDMNYETEEAMIGNIASKLFTEYPNEFAKGSERDSWIDVTCNHDNGWSISQGHYGMRI